jgi:predicted PurR-regulated permease PerM
MTNQEPKSNKFPFSVSVAAFIIIIAGVVYSASVVTQLLMALFLAVVAAQPVLWLQKKKVPQWLSVLLVFSMMLLIFIGFGGLIGGSLSNFSKNADQYGNNLNEIGNSVIQILNEKGISVSMEKFHDFLDPAKIMSLTASILGQLGAIMGNALTILILALFLLLELDSISLKAKAVLKDSNVSLSMLDAIVNGIRHYLSIKTVIGLATGICIWICLAIIGVDYAILWALIAFLLNYVPNIGSIIAGIPAVLFVAIQLGPVGVMWTIISYVVVNMVIGNVIEPKMMGRGMGLSTFVVFLSLIFWGFVLGTVGMFLSVPLTMVMKIVFEQNPKTRWIAVVLGTREDAESSLKDEPNE